MPDRLLELVGDAYGFEDLDAFRVGLVELLGRAVPSLYVSYNEVGAQPADTFAFSRPELDEAQVRLFARYAHENPLLAALRRTSDGRPRRFSDELTRTQLHALALYREFYRPLGIESQIAFTLPARPPLVVAIALSRGMEDYSDAEAQLLGQARPHLIQAYRVTELSSARAAALAAAQDGLEMIGRHMVVLDPRGRIEFATSHARALLGPRARSRSGGRDAVGPELRAWIEARRGRRTAPEPLVLRSGEEAVVVRLLPTVRGDRRDVLLLDAGDGELTVGALRGLGLTEREAQVLRMVALGRSAAVTAAELGVAQRTVDKHLQRVYAKLGVTSRYEAAATAWAAVGVGPAERATASRRADAP